MSTGAIIIIVVATSGVLMMRFRKRWLANINIAITNRITGLFAGWLPGFGILTHVGRKSGKVYRTPVNVFRAPNGFIIALTFSSQSEWVKNVLAAGGCELKTRGKQHQLSAPKIVRDPTRQRFPIPGADRSEDRGCGRVYGAFGSLRGIIMKIGFRCVLVCATLLVIAGWNFAQSSDGRSPQNESAKVESAQMELVIFARFHAREGKEEAVAAELRDAVIRVHKESGCLSIEVYRSVRDSRLFFLHSRWVDEAAFDKHVERQETNQFVDRVQRLIDHPFDVARTHLLFQ